MNFSAEVGVYVVGCDGRAEEGSVVVQVSFGGGHVVFFRADSYLVSGRAKKIMAKVFSRVSSVISPSEASVSSSTTSGWCSQPLSLLARNHVSAD